MHLLHIKLSLYAGHCIGAGDSKISKNGDDPSICRIYSLPQETLMKQSHRCKVTATTAPVTSQEGRPVEVMLKLRWAGSRCLERGERCVMKARRGRV